MSGDNPRDGGDDIGVVEPERDSCEGVVDLVLSLSVFKNTGRNWCPSLLLSSSLASLSNDKKQSTAEAATRGSLSDIALNSSSSSRLILLSAKSSS